MIKYTTFLKQEDLDKCKKFAEESVDTSINHYKRRGQGNREKIIQDIICGKMGELGVYNMLQQAGYKVTYPDFAIYKGRKKSFDADMTADKKGKTFKVHCKSQTDSSRTKYGASWILQYGGNGFGHTDKLFKKREPNDFLCAAVVSGLEVTVYTAVKISTLFDLGMVELPALDWLAKTKRAIYYKTISSLPESKLMELIVENDCNICGDDV